jgi:hypothetical protein
MTNMQITIRITIIRWTTKGENPVYDPTEDTLRPTQEITVCPKVSINDEEIIFYKFDFQKSIQVSHNTGDSLVDWITEKANKNVFSMWFLLSTRLKNVSVASWTCETSSDKLSLLNLQLGDKNYFTVGYGSR